MHYSNCRASRSEALLPGTGRCGPLRHPSHPRAWGWRAAQSELVDGRRDGRRSKLVVLVDELGRIEGLVVSLIEGARADVERLLVLLRLIQLLDDLSTPAAPWT